jgi:hypothetical protein
MIEELLATEYTYVNDLKTLVNVFFTPLSTNPDVLPKEELPIIFSVCSPPILIGARHYIAIMTRTSLIDLS